MALTRLSPNDAMNSRTTGVYKEIVFVGISHMASASER